MAVVETLERRVLLAAAPALPLKYGQWLDVPGANSVVHDAGRDVLLVAADTGLVHRYDLRNKRFLDPWDVGDSLLGADVSADGRYLYAGSAEMSPAGTPGAATGTVYRVRLSDGEVEAIAFAGAAGESGVLSVAAAADGVYFTTASDGPGRTPVRRIDPATGAVAEVASLPTPFDGGLVNGVAVRSADRGLVLFADASGSATYELAGGKYWSVSGAGAGTRGTFGPTSDPLFSGADAAVSRDGSLVVPNPNSVYDRHLEFAHAGLLGFGVAFHPQRDVMYVTDSVSHVEVVDTDAWRSVNLISIDPLYGGYPTNQRLPGDRVVADDYLFVANGAGVFMDRLFSAPQVLAAATVTVPGEAVDVTVSAQFLGDYPDPDYRGTVRLTSTDVHVQGLPDEYTFTAADRGEHTFQVRFATGGTQHVTATDVNTRVAGESAGVNVDTAGPVAAVRPGATPRVGGTEAYEFAVEFSDARGVDTLTIGEGDITLVGPKGETVPVRLLSKGESTSGPGNTAFGRFAFDPPGGRWDPSDDGPYTVRVAPGAVADTEGNLAPGGDAGTFRLGLPATAPDLVVSATATEWPAVLPTVSQRVKVTVTVANVGTADANGPFSVALYVSEDTVIGPFDDARSVDEDRTVINVSFGGAVAPGQSAQKVVEFAVPALHRGGLWYVLPRVFPLYAPGPFVPELDPTNNDGPGPRVPMAAAYADVVVSLVKPPPDVVPRGGIVTVKLRLENMGSILTRGGYALQLFRQTAPDPAPQFSRVAATLRRVTLRPRAAKVVSIRLKVPRRRVEPGPHVLSAGFVTAPDYTDTNRDNSVLVGTILVTK